MSVTTLGLDIGGTCVKAAVRVDGRFVRMGQSKFYARPNAQQLYEAIRSAAGELRDLAHVGLCVPGILDRPRRVITLAVNVPGLEGVELDKLVPDALGIDGMRPTTISNDGAAAGYNLFESRKLAGRVMVLTLGTGVGAAVLDEGRLLRVDGDSPGHIGQIDVSVPGVPAIGPDGGEGGLEAYIGVPALQVRYGPDFANAMTHFTGDEPPVQALVRALRICHAIYRPDHIFLCGGVGIRLKNLLPLLHEKVSTNLTNVSRRHWTLDCGDDDFHAARGAAQLADSI